MKRKIVQHGSSSLTITLPTKWASKNNLKKGDELDVIEEGTALKLLAQAQEERKTKIITSAEQGLFTKNDLSHLYQLGYDELEIQFNDAKTLDEIKSRLPECIGYVLIEQTINKIVIKNIATTLDAEFEILLRKSFQITNEMANQLGAALEESNKESVSNIRAMETLNNRFTDVCLRILNKKGYKVQDKTLVMYDLVKTIERVADEFKYIADVYLKNPKKVSPTTIELYKEVVKYYLQVYDLMYSFKPKQKENIFLDRKPLLKKLELEITSSKGNENLFNHYLLSLLQKSYECAGTILTLRT